jgi:hypothetical protein
MSFFAGEMFHLSAKVQGLGGQSQNKGTKGKSEWKIAGTV